MSINGVSSLGGFFLSSQSAISEETRKKLLALGIDPSSVTSEAQAQMLIAAELQKQQVAQTTNESSSKNTCSSELELLTRAKNLAKRIGVSVSSNQTLKEILDKISAKIDSLPSNQQEVKQFSEELDSINNEYNSVVQNQNSMFTAMNMTANLNKLMLGLK